ncbi:hypothetical protein TWF694_008649 [Orbilia ellipsospora]|uniref:Myb-like domain-containing protein n=1 Tax=Orbilia ellipsospora TaxID=2528407 RepID=A0AAV9XGU2_9PEZI
MGGYMIARSPKEGGNSEYPNPLRCARESRLEADETAGSRYITFEGIADDTEKPATIENVSCARSNELARYKHLFPSAIPAPLHLTSGDAVTSTSNCHAFSSEIATNPRSHQIYPPRLILAGRADRINKSRRISPSNTKESAKPPGSPQSKSELPKTPMSWSTEDDILLRDLKELKKLGWKEISAYFPKRTAHACQFRWRRLVSGTLKGHRHCPPYTANGSSSISPDRKNSDEKGFFEPFERPGPKSCSADLFDLSSVDSDSKQLMTNLAISSPSSPSELRLKRQQSPTTVSRSVSLSPPMLRQNCYPQVDERDVGHSGWEPDDCRESDRIDTRHVSTLLEDSLQTLKSHRDYTYHSAGSYRPPESTSWTSEEDSLLLNRRLSFDEVSILLHHRSEEAIWSRMGILRSTISNSLRASCSSLIT